MSSQERQLQHQQRRLIKHMSSRVDSWSQDAGRRRPGCLECQAPLLCGLCLIIGYVWLCQLTRISAAVRAGGIKGRPAAPRTSHSPHLPHEAHRTDFRNSKWSWERSSCYCSPSSRAAWPCTSRAWRRTQSRKLARTTGESSRTHSD